MSSKREEYQVKEFYNKLSPSMIFGDYLSGVTYPAISGNHSNFIEDYLSKVEEYERYYFRKYGDMIFRTGLYDDELADWQDTNTSILELNLENWARLYYALSLSYNPLYNVDGTTTTTYSEQVDTSRDGTRSDQSSYGAKSTTNGARNDTTTDYSVSYDSTTEKEDGKRTDAIGEQVISEAARTDTLTRSQTTDDTRTYGEHTVTEERAGNIGVTKSTDLLESEWDFRQRSFFQMLFASLAKEQGLYWG